MLNLGGGASMTGTSASSAAFLFSSSIFLLDALVLRFELLFRRGLGEPVFLGADLPFAVPGEGVEGGHDRVDVEEVDGRDAEDGGEDDGRADAAEGVGNGEVNDVAAEEAAGTVDIGLALDEMPAAKVLEVEQGATAGEKEKEPDRLPRPLDFHAEKTCHAAAQGKEREEISAETEAKIEHPGQARADITNEIGRDGVGRIDVGGEIGPVVGKEGQEGDDVERKPEKPDDLLEEREGRDVFGPRLAVRDGTTRHEEG